jgi:type IV secretory pathway VirB6-like protein
MNLYNAIIFALIQVLIAGLSALVSVIIAYGAIASTIVGILGPIFIPFLVFDKLEFLFWGWLRAFLDSRSIRWSPPRPSAFFPNS